MGIWKDECEVREENLDLPAHFNFILEIKKLSPEELKITIKGQPQNLKLDL